MDLLQRLLAFDPDRRSGAEEALAHEYLEDLEDTDNSMLPSSASSVADGA